MKWFGMTGETLKGPTFAAPAVSSTASLTKPQFVNVCSH